VSLATTIIAMQAAGCTAEQIADVARTFHAEEQERADRRRALAAERQRKFKAKRNASNADNALPTVTSVTAPTPKDPLPNLVTVEVNQSPTPYSPPTPVRRFDWPEDFGCQLWAIYPRKTEKKAGMEALDRLHRADRVAWADVIGGVEAIQHADPQFVPALARWIKGERWKDERIAERPPPHRQAKTNSGLDGVHELRRMLNDAPPQQPRLRLAN
jgi:hypothetical protein